MIRIRNRIHRDQPSLATILKRPAIIGFFVAVFLMQVSHGPYYAFCLIFMQDHGCRDAHRPVVGAGVLAEVGLFMVMHRFCSIPSVRGECLSPAWRWPAHRWLMIGQPGGHCRCCCLRSCCMRPPSGPSMRRASTWCIII